MTATKTADKISPATAETAASPKRRGGGFRHLVRVAVSLALVGVILRWVDVGQIADILAGAAPVWLLMGVTSMLLERFYAAYRWQVLIRVDDPGLQLWSIVKILFVTNFFGMFLPGGGIEVLRALVLTRSQNSSLSVSVTSVALDRLFGLGTLLLTAAIGCWIADVWIPASMAPWVWGGLTLCGLGLLAFTSAQVRVFAGHLVPQRLFGRAQALRGYLQALARRPGLLAWAVILAIGIQIVRVFSVWFLAVAVGIEVPLAVYFAFVPITIIAQLLPVGVGGLGVREAAFVLLFGTVGVSAEAAVALSLLVYVTAIVSSLPGAWIAMAYRKPT